MSSRRDEVQHFERLAARRLMGTAQDHAQATRRDADRLCKKEFLSFRVCGDELPERANDPLAVGQACRLLTVRRGRRFGYVASIGLPITSHTSKRLTLACIELVDILTGQASHFSLFTFHQSPPPHQSLRVWRLALVLLSCAAAFASAARGSSYQFSRPPRKRLLAAKIG